MPGSRRAAGSKKRKQSARAAEAPLKQKESTPLAGRVIERADGFYWDSAAKKGETRGPFATLAEAEADMLSDGGAEGEDPEAPQGLQEAESELGISEWIDPDTGGPAEDHVPRIEDH